MRQFPWQAANTPNFFFCLERETPQLSLLPNLIVACKPKTSFFFDVAQSPSSKDTRLTDRPNNNDGGAVWAYRLAPFSTRDRCPPCFFETCNRTAQRFHLYQNVCLAIGPAGLTTEDQAGPDITIPYYR